MKSKKTIITVVIIAIIALAIVLRLVSNKRSFDEQLRVVSEFNTVIPVITDTVKYRNFVREFSVNGTFQPYREITVVSETQGKIISISSNTGERVRAGEVLASIDNELYISQLDLAKFNLEKAEKDMKRFEQLSKGDAVTMQQYEAINQVLVNARSAYTAAKIQVDNSSVYAPFDGIITKRMIEKGAYLLQGMPVFDIIEIDKLKFIAKLTGSEIEKVQKGQIIKVAVDNYPGVFYEGKVIAIVVKADQSKRYDAEVEVTNHANHPINPGMFGTGLFTSNSEDRVLTIPRKAISGSIENPEIFVVRGDSVIIKNIQAELLNDKVLAVNQGLEAGEIIVISGQINLVNGSKIKLNN